WSLTSTSLTAGDLNNDGQLDVVTSLIKSDKAAIFLGQGDGTFQDGTPAATGTAPVAVQMGDFNGDGRLDLATANYLSGDVTVSLGLGDGTHQAAVRFAVGTRPVSLVVGDFNGDGRLDFATANSGSDDVSVLLGLGDGMFRGEVRLAVGTVPLFLLAADINGDGRLDLATANYVSGDVSLLLGRGDGTFRTEMRIAAGTAPIGLVHGDFNRDGRPDLAVVSQTSDEVTVFVARPDGTFQELGRFAVGRLPRSLAVDDFDRDGILDLAAANNDSDDVSVLLGRGDGTFRDQVRYPVARYPFAIIAADINGDGRVDLATANQLGAETSVLLGLGDGTFVPPEAVGTALRSTPVVADLDGDGAADVAVTNRAGNILFRRGRPAEPGAFDPPVILNPDPRYAVRDLAVVFTPQGPILAALDAHDSSVSFYSRGADGNLTRTGGLAVPGTLPARLAAGDLNGDRRDDLVVVAGGSTEVFVYLQGEPGASATGAFAAAPDFTADVGLVPSDVALVDADGDGRLDIEVTSQFAGDVRVLLNLAPAPFGSGLRFRAGTGLYYLDDLTGTPQVRSAEATTALVAGNFDTDPGLELVALNSGSNSFSVLQGNGSGGFLNPQAAQTFATGPRPAAVVAGRFNADPFLDLAVLNEGTGTVSVFLGSATGKFTENVATDANGNPVLLSAGNLPTGLSTHDLNGDGRLDLLVGNDFGDVLTLLGNGDGTFRPYQRTDRNIALAVTDFDGDGKPDFIFANEALDHVSVQYSQAGQRFTQDRSNGLLAPGAVSTADLNGDRVPDLVVANSGGNNVLVYLGTGNGEFGPAHSFFAGTNPAAITVTELNGDTLPDLVVANEGSNDVTLLLGQGQGSSWTLTPGPRVRSAGQGPVSTVVRDVTGPGRRPDGIPDLVVTNSQSNTVSVIPGVGQGFFDDRSPDIFQTGIDPRQALVGNFDGHPGLDLVTINAGSNDLSFFAGFGAGRSIGTGGHGPVAAESADFNGDGLTDLVVANNGDGRVALFLGEADGPALARAFSRSDILHPTALALTAEGDLYFTDEGREAAILLTSFGIPLPSAIGGDQRPPLQDVFLVNGPGFATGLDIISLRGEPTAVESGESTGAGEGSEPTGKTSALPLASSTLVGGVAMLWSDDRSDEAAIPGGTQSDQPDLIDFMIGVDDALRRAGPDASKNDGSRGPLSVEKWPAAVDELFRDWPPAAASAVARGAELLASVAFDEVQSATSMLNLALETIGRSNLSLCDPGIGEIARGLSEAGTEAARWMADYVRSQLQGAIRFRLPGGPRASEAAISWPIGEVEEPPWAEEAQPDLPIEAANEVPKMGEILSSTLSFHTTAMQSFVAALIASGWCKGSGKHGQKADRQRRRGQFHRSSEL
ncbi:MAG TPA: VCBS repeat-containing protein, partial [Gemmataceae bacterium]|nr:VCBS repeat-containing protein [Gemmataceae bacterium]